MPPRGVSGPWLSSASRRSSQSICPSCQLQTRSFSSTLPTSYEKKKTLKRQPTQARRKMYQWLAGPGRQFEEPRPGSTNYLGAYDRSGKMIRMGNKMPAVDNENIEDSEGNESSDPNKGKAGDGKSESPYLLDANGNARLDKDGYPVLRLPPETVEDLRPFPLNKHFISEPVLSDDFRNEIYRRLTAGGETIRKVSADLSVSIERVAAVYRLKEVEKRWARKGKKLQTEYQSIVMDMLPQSKIPGPESTAAPHENINDLPVHPATLVQMFLPTSESRQFNRVDAGRAFHPDLLPADDRIPHPEMIEFHKDAKGGFTQSERATRNEERYADIQAADERKVEKARLAEERHTKVVTTHKYEFRFKDAWAENAGSDGRGRHAVGWRYGQASMDRKKGQVRIPTKVD